MLLRTLWVKRNAGRGTPAKYLSHFGCCLQKIEIVDESIVLKMRGAFSYPNTAGPADTAGCCNAGAKNNTAARALLTDFLAGAKVVDGKVTAKVDGESVTLAARIEAMKKDAATDFLFGAVTREGWTPGEPSGGQKPGGGKKPSEMTYAELEEYLASNPGAGLE